MRSRTDHDDSSVCITTLLRISNLDIKADVLYTAQPSVLWTIIEANVGIICACLPLMRSVIIYLIPWFSEHTSRARSSKSRKDSAIGADATANGNAPQDADRNRIVNDKHDPYGVCSLRDDDAASLNSSEEAIIEKPRRSAQGQNWIEHLEMTATADTRRNG